MFFLDIIVDSLALLNMSSRDRYVFLVTYIHRPRTITEVARITGVTRKTAGESVTRLVGLGLMIVVKHKASLMPISILPNACQEALAARLRLEYDLSPTKGEFLTRIYSQLRIRNRRWVYNARPDFLENPETSEPMEYDCYLPDERFGIDYMGIQHFATTEMYPSAEQLARLQARDKAKAEISKKLGIRFVTITPETLLPEAFDKLLPPDLELYYIDREGKFFAAYRDLCMKYTRRARQASRAKAQ